MNERRAQVQRETLETQIAVTVDLDGKGTARLASGVPFLEIDGCQYFDVRESELWPVSQRQYSSKPTSKGCPG